MARTIRYVSRDARRVLILLNAKAGARASLERVEDLRRRLERDGMQVDMLMHATRRGHIRHTSYIQPILASIRRYEYPELKVYCDAVAEAGQGSVEPVSGPIEASTVPLAAPRAARWVFVVNLPKYAGGLRLVPDAVGSDGLLDVCLFRRGSLMHGLRYFAGVVLGRHRRWEDFSHVRVRKLRIESDREVPYQLDGDPGGVLPLEISVLPGRVRMVVTETWALRHGYRHARQPVTDSDVGDGCPDS